MHSSYVSIVRFMLSHPSFFFNDTAPTEIYTLSLHDALPISGRVAELGELLDAAVVGRPAGREGARAAGEARQRAQAGQAAGRPGRTSCLVADTGRDGGAVPGGLVPVRPGPHGRG